MFVTRATLRDYRVNYQDRLMPSMTFTNICMDLTLEVDNTFKSGSRCVYGRLVAVTLESDYVIKEFHEEDLRLFTHDGLANTNNLCYWWHLSRAYLQGYDLNKRMFILCDIVTTSCALVARELVNKHRVYSSDLIDECNTVVTEHLQLLLSSDISRVITHCNLRALDK